MLRPLLMAFMLCCSSGVLHSGENDFQHSEMQKYLVRLLVTNLSNYHIWQGVLGNLRQAGEETYWGFLDVSFQYLYSIHNKNIEKCNAIIADNPEEGALIIGTFITDPQMLLDTSAFFDENAPPL